VKQVEQDISAPGFTLDNLDDVPVRLSQYRGERRVVLVFNRGFT